VTVRHRNASSYLECKHCIAACLVGRYVALSPCDLTVSEQEINQEIKQERDKMSKNLTRKGLAFGALVALGTSVIAGAPANAAVSNLTVASSYGTATSTVLGQSFDVAISGSGITATANLFKLYVEGAVASDFDSTSTVNGRGVTDLDAADSGGTAYADFANVTAGSATLNTAVIDGITPVAASYTQLKLKLGSAVTSTRTIKVTPFVDDIIADGKPTAGEVKGNTLEITFVKSSEITATTVLSAPQIGSTSVSATVTLDKNINLQQLTAANTPVNVFFAKNGTYIKSSDASSTVAAAWSKNDAALSASLDSVTAAIAEGNVYSAQAYFGSVASGTKTGAISTKTVSKGADDILNTAAATNLSSTIVDIEDDKFIVPAKNTNLLPSDSTESSFSVRKGTTTVPFSSEVVYKDDTNGSPVVASGVPVKVVVTATTLASGSKFSIGSQVADSTTSNATFTLSTVTDASGKIVFDLGATGAQNDAVTVVVSVLDQTAYVAADTITLIWTAATAQANAVLLDAVGKTSSNADESSLSVKAGGSYTLNFALYDNFGALYSGTDAKYLQATGGSVVKFVDGKASITRNDSNVAAATNTIYYSVTSTDTVNTPTSGKKVNVYAQTNVTPGFVTATKGSESLTISTKTFSAGDARAGDLRGIKWSSSSLGTEVTVSGTLLNTDGVALKGSPVTISAAGLLFTTGYEASAASTNKVWGVGSLTVITDDAGAYSVRVYSNKAGKQEIKVTAGAATASVTPEWPAQIATKGSAITITAPATAAPGTTAAITVALKDSKGNAVKTDGSTLTFSYSVRVSGAGSSGTINQYTDADGLTKFNQVIGSGETGSFVVTVTYDADGAGHGYAAIEKTATVTIAPAAVVVVEPVSKIGTANGRIYANVKDGKGSVVTVRIANKWFTKTALNNDYTFSFKNKKGAKVSVKVYVDGDLSASKTITVK
jgi:hypothetical protein